MFSKIKHPLNKVYSTRIAETDSNASKKNKKRKNVSFIPAVPQKAEHAERSRLPSLSFFHFNVSSNTNINHGPPAPPATDAEI